MSREMYQAYPLTWPPHRPRTKYRKRAAFHRKIERRSESSGSLYYDTASLTVEDAQSRTRKQLTMLGASNVVISSNLRLRQDGLPYSQQRQPDDPGIAVYFQLKKQPHCLSCDTWDRAADNLAAVAKYVEAMRGQIRWGVGDIAAMFAGFKALPGAIITPQAMTVEEAAEFLGGSNHPSVATVLMRDAETFKETYRSRAKELHPDANGGQTHPDWHKLQMAAEAMKQHHNIS